MKTEIDSTPTPTTKRKRWTYLYTIEIYHPDGFWMKYRDIEADRPSRALKRYLTKLTPPAYKGCPARVKFAGRAY